MVKSVECILSSCLYNCRKWSYASCRFTSFRRLGVWGYFCHCIWKPSSTWQTCFIRLFVPEFWIWVLLK